MIEKTFNTKIYFNPIDGRIKTDVKKLKEDAAKKREKEKKRKREKNNKKTL